MIVDTDVLIWFFRGNRNALRELQSATPFSISCITQMELLQGAKNKQEQKALMNQLKAFGAEILQINEQVSILASQLVRSFSLSHGITIADALIAAAALDCKDILFTANTKHFKFIPKLETKQFVH